MRFYLGTDVGGTFTDLWATDDRGNAQVYKSPTTPDVLTGVLNVVRIAAEANGLTMGEFCAAIEHFGHGTTVGLNALLTGTAANTLIVTTEGFGDTLEIGRMRRQTAGLAEAEVTDFFLHNRYLPLVPRGNIVEVDERIDARGQVVKALDENQAARALRAKSREIGNVEAIAVCTLWSTANPSHELRIRDIAAEVFPGVFISLSHDVAPVVGEYARMSTTAANAALGPIAGRYLSRLQEELRREGMRMPVVMMTNAGGVLPTEVLNGRPAYALFSGPAAGVIASAHIGAQIGVKNILSTDIGGTSFDVGVIVDGRPIMRREISVGGASICIPSIDVDSIGAGGGSIAAVSFGKLTVGPRSAGSTPGPVCYQRGGQEPTSTDADLVLGVIDPDHFIGGRMKLDVEGAKRAIHDKIAKPLDISMLEAACGIRDVLDSKMSDLLRRATIERGKDPRDFLLFANGGAGPSHAWALVRDLGIRKFIVPAAATVQSAFGCAVSGLGLTKERPVYLRVSTAGTPAAKDLDAVAGTLSDIDREARSELSNAGARGAINTVRTLAIRYRGQSNTLDIAVINATFDATAFKAAIAEFEREYEANFGEGSTDAKAGFEIVNARVLASGVLEPPPTENRGVLEAGVARSVVFDVAQGPIETAIWRTSFPPPDAQVVGPAIVEFPGQNVVVPPGYRAVADRIGNLHVASEP
jgi:N-methylhydantoinase A